MGLFRVIIGAYDSGDEDARIAHGDETGRRTVHGSPHKGKLSALGGRAMGRDAKPSGFFHRDPGRPGGRR